MHDVEDNSMELPQYRQSMKISEKSRRSAAIMHDLRSSSPSRGAAPPRKITLLEKIGLWNFVINSVGSLFVIGILIFLWFLWMGNEDNALRRQLILSENLQRTVTLASVFARTVITFQASLCTAMVAALILELSTGFGVLKAAALSIRRFSGGPPIMLLRGGMFEGNVWFLQVLVFLLTFTTIASQFTSTALVTDLGLAPILGPPVPGEATYSTNFSRIQLIEDYEPDYTTHMPSIYPTFSEYVEPPDDGHSVDDTGPAMRAILPISTPSIRENMSNFTGFGTLLNSHVVCMKPVLTDVTLFNGAGESQVDHPYIRGSVSIGQQLPPGITFFNYTGESSNPFNSVNFTCFLATARPDNNDWPISMCIAGNYFGNPNITGGGSDGGGRAGIHGLRANSLFQEDLLFDPLSYILVNYTGQLPEPHGIQENSNWTDISASDSAWTTLQNHAPFFPDLASISLSYCFTNFAAFDANISVSSPIIRTEPILKAPSTSGLALQADEVLRQLGADGTNTSFPERGILSLDYSDAWPTFVLGSDDNFTQALDGSYGFGMIRSAGLAEGQTVATTWAMCTNCGISDRNIDTNTTGISAALSSIFQSSLQTSGSPAKALQAMLTVLNMMQYYDRLQQFEVSGPISFTLIETTLQPIHHYGLVAVTAGLMLHLAIVGTITFLFLVRMQLSFIGESWHAVAQLQSAEVISLLEETSLMRDEEVKEMMLGKGQLDEMVLKREGGARAHVVRRDRWI